MATPIINLDDRRFDDLVEEAKTRLSASLPELTQIVPGDPVHALVDLFAWMTETVIYRANLIPERQRQAFINLLGMARRRAVAARGIVSIDATGLSIPPLVRGESELKAGRIVLSTLGDLQPLPVATAVMTKVAMSTGDLDDLGLNLEQLRLAYGMGSATPDPFRPIQWLPGAGPLDLSAALDNSAYLALSVHPKVRLRGVTLDKFAESLAGQVLNIGVAPFTTEPAELATKPRPRRLEWDLFWLSETGETRYLPLEQLDDTSRGARQPGVVRLRLPLDDRLLRAHSPEDPGRAGLGDTPPLAPASVQEDRLLFWIRLRSVDEPGLKLGYVGVNAVDVVGQGVARDMMLGVGTGRPGQRVQLPHPDVDVNSLQVEVEAHGNFEQWLRVDYFDGLQSARRVYVADGAEGMVRFGVDARPGAKKRIRASYYRYGGGSAGNLPAGSIKSLSEARAGLVVRHEWPTTGGRDAESVEEAERRIPVFLTHRDRAVAAEDFVRLARENPINPVARAEVAPGFLPGASLSAARNDIPGVVSLFVMPPQQPALAAPPQPSKGLLADVYDFVSARTLLGTELYVLSPQFVEVGLSIGFDEVNPSERQTVVRDLERAMLEYLWALAPGGAGGSGWMMGRAVEVDELRTVAGRVAGVRSISGLHLYHQQTLNLPGRRRRVWRRLGAGQLLTLAAYQLPQLVAISVHPGAGTNPPPPPGIGPDQPVPSGPKPTPAPVIPDVC